MCVNHSHREPDVQKCQLVSRLSGLTPEASRYHPDYKTTYKVIYKTI